VFGGSEEVYSDYSETSPINDYGMLKAHAEKMVLSIDPNSIIIRPLLMYGWPNFNRRLNPVVKWINDLRLGINIRVVNDIFTQPLAVWDCATAIWKGIEIDASGPVNISGGESISLYNFALLTSEIFGLNSGLIQPVSSLYFQNLAPRPFKTSFDLNRLKTEFNFVPSKLRAGIEELKLTENKIV
jgi:dTDP-4-dehydrorhamnose reductase